MPSGAWDAHAHVIGGNSAFPLMPQRGYTPPPASVDQYIAMLDTVGIEYGVVVQVSVHGHDNRLLLAALRRYPERLKGVAVIKPDALEHELIELKEAGVVGVRVNELFAGGTGADQLEALARRCIDHGWHLDLALPGTRLRELAPVLVRLGVRLVIDHMGWCSAVDGVNQPDFQAVLSLIRNSDTWVKLSGAYRVSGLATPYADSNPFVQALVDAAPDRMVWGSDWPHVAIFDPAHMPNVGTLLDVLHVQLEDRTKEIAVLVENPRRLYALPGVPAGKLHSAQNRFL